MSSTSLDHVTNAQTAAAITALEKAAGGRDALVAALSQADPSDDLSYVVNLIADPTMDARSLAEVCRAGGVKVGELMEAFKRGLYAKMFVEVAAKVAQATPAVVEDVMTRAQPHEVPCPVCRGTLTVLDASAKPSACRNCINPDGVPTGQVTVLPDLDRQKLALDLAQVLPKKGPSVVVGVDNRSMHLGDVSSQGYDKLIAATDAILHGRRPTSRSRTTVETTPTPTPSPPDSIDAEVLSE